MLQQYESHTSNDDIKESRNQKANKRSLRLSALLSTTAMAFFLEACGTGSDGRPEIPVDESTAGGVSNVSRRVVLDQVSGDQAYYRVTTREVAPGELPQIEGQDITAVIEIMKVDANGNQIPGTQPRQIVRIDGGALEVTINGIVFQASVEYERSFLPGDRQIAKTLVTYINDIEHA